jgi:hypothetical protein
VIEDFLTAERPRARYVVGRDAKAQLALSTVLPRRLWERIVASQTGG